MVFSDVQGVPRQGWKGKMQLESGEIRPTPFASDPVCPVQKVLGQESCKTEVSRIFRIFVPNSAPNFVPNFPRIFRGLFVLRFLGNGDLKKFTKNPRHFSMQNSQANTKKLFTKFFWQSKKVAKSQRAPNPPDFAQPCLSGWSSPPRGYKFGCVCSYMAGITQVWRYKFGCAHVWSVSFRPTQTGLCKFGWAWSSLKVLPSICQL